MAHFQSERRKKGGERTCIEPGGEWWSTDNNGLSGTFCHSSELSANPGVHVLCGFCLLRNTGHGADRVARDSPPGGLPASCQGGCRRDSLLGCAIGVLA